MIENYGNSEFCDPFDEKRQNFFMKLEHCGRYLYAMDIISNEDVVADISCATGYGSNLLAQKAKSVIGVDVNDKYLEDAIRNYKRDNLCFMKADLDDKLQLSNADISIIVSFETIEHTTRPFEVVQNFYDILPIGGRLVLSFPNAKKEIFDENGKNLDPFHLSLIQYDEMVAFLKQIGFKINCVLGQSLINKLVNRIFEMESNLKLDFDGLYSYEKSNILQQSKILAYPNDEDVQNSYSFIFDLSKIL